MIAFMMLQVIKNPNIMHNIYIMILTLIVNREKQKKGNGNGGVICHHREISVKNFTQFIHI